MVTGDNDSYGVAAAELGYPITSVHTSRKEVCRQQSQLDPGAGPKNEYEGIDEKLEKLKEDLK